MRTVWLIRAQGEGTHDERFCFNRQDVAQAIREFVVGESSGDPVLESQQQSELDDWLKAFNDPDEWCNGAWLQDVGEIHHCLQAYVIDPRQVARLVNKVSEEWLGAA